MTPEDRLPESPDLARQNGALRARVAELERILAATSSSRGEGAAALDRSEARLRRVEEELCQAEHIVAAVTDHLSLIGRDGTLRALNVALLEALGRSRGELEGSHVSSLFDEGHFRLEIAPLLERCLRGERVRVASHWYEFPALGRRLIDLTLHPCACEDGAIFAVVLHGQDVTERRALEEQLQQSHKLEAIGRLAGGVAHDFNNLLTVILGNAQLAEDEARHDASMLELLQAIREAAQRAKAITRQLLGFARREIIDPAVLDPNQVLERVVGLLSGLVGENVRVETHAGTGIPPVEIDQGQLEQVLVNLVLNARDAMPYGGRVTIATRLEELALADAPADLEPGPYVVIEVRDTGVGMTAETQRHAFEPFFTTKDPGEGTGLGLATCYGIVRRYGGHVELESVRGAGTTVRVLLPPTERGLIPVSPRERAATRGSETILLVEDEVAVRQMALRALTQLGYRVLQAATGEEALELAEAEAQPIHLLLSDVVLPGIAGPDLVRLVASRRPDTKVLYTSGYTEDNVMRRQVLVEGRPFLAKPYTPTLLAQKVRMVLDGIPHRQMLPGAGEDAGPRDPAPR